MPELCYTATQVKLIQGCIVTMMGLSIFQALTIRRLVKEQDYGRNQFNKLHGAAEYLLNVIEQNNIELTDFDLIALSSITGVGVEDDDDGNQ